MQGDFQGKAIKLLKTVSVRTHISPAHGVRPRALVISSGSDTSSHWKQCWCCENYGHDKPGACRRASPFRAGGIERDQQSLQGALTRWTIDMSTVLMPRPLRPRISVSEGGLDVTRASRTDIMVSHRVLPAPAAAAER